MQFVPGTPVEYYSQSQGAWLPAVVQGFDQATGKYVLDIHPGAEPARIRPRGAGGAPPPQHAPGPGPCPVPPRGPGPPGPGGFSPGPHGAPPMGGVSPGPQGAPPMGGASPPHGTPGGRPPEAAQAEQQGGGWWPFNWLGGGGGGGKEEERQQRERPKHKPVTLESMAKPPTEDMPFWTGQQVKLRHGMVNYVLAGPPWPAPTIVCLHGISSSLSSWEALMPLLTQRGYRVLAYDLYGFGLSAKPSAGLTIGTYVDQLNGLLDHLISQKQLTKNEKVQMIGFSMGGRIALEFARRHHARVARLLLVSPAGLLRQQDTPCSPVVFWCLRARLCCGLVPLIRCLLQICMCGCMKRRLMSSSAIQHELTPDVREPQKFEKHKHELVNQFTHRPSRCLGSYLEALRHMPLWDSDRAFKEVADTQSSRVPVLFIWGDRDTVLPLEEVNKTLSRIFGPHGTSCIIVPGGGHGLILEDAAQISDYAVCWFSDEKDRNWMQMLDHCRLQPRPEMIGAATAAKRGLASA